MISGNSLSAAAGTSAILLRVRRVIFLIGGENSPVWIAILA
jgi:hypothetical protein